MSDKTKLDQGFPKLSTIITSFMEMPQILPFKLEVFINLETFAVLLTSISEVEP